MKRLLFTLAATASAVAMAPAANAAILTPGASGVAFTAFDPTTQGTLLASGSAVGQPTTNYNATGRYAVYRNTFGTLDFYYQITVNSMANTDEQLVGLGAFNFAGYVVDAMVSGAAAGDPDGAGIFTAPNNPGGFTSTASRAPGTGGTIRADFNANTLVTGETSATYIFRTSAASYTTGTFSLQDGIVANIPAFAPIGPSVPEPATWAMMMLGFGAMGGMLRTRRRSARIRFA